ncbi:hypothetical protein A33I_02375 [Alkalihalophilus marmarensis DSM 21297]|uniref:Uncharacterized protein n=1 Tax=Alkalihalophilus marmarensis DSM 21297 TaxID=1188261 RepID=U6SHM1_9BACI|nr:hypothetical protein A33I_02375 [Alkalihalophilus marmarensis DSM 21297]
MHHFYPQDKELQLDNKKSGLIHLDRKRLVWHEE